MSNCVKDRYVGRTGWILQKMLNWPSWPTAVHPSAMPSGGAKKIECPVSRHKGEVIKGDRAKCERLLSATASDGVRMKSCHFGRFMQIHGVVTVTASSQSQITLLNTDESSFHNTTDSHGNLHLQVLIYIYTYV